MSGMETTMNKFPSLTLKVTVLIDLNSINFLAGIGYDIQSWTSNPNGSPDPVMLNDSAEVKNIYGALSGTYTIGGVAPDFINFSTPVTALNLGGILGPVTFNVRDGNYNEQISIDEVEGSDTTNTITFQSESGNNTGVVLTSNSTFSDNYTVRFNGADYVTFSNMTLEATNVSYARVIELTGASNNIHIDGNILIGRTVTTTCATIPGRQ